MTQEILSLALTAEDRILAMRRRLILAILSPMDFSFLCGGRRQRKIGAEYGRISAIARHWLASDQREPVPQLAVRNRLDPDALRAQISRIRKREGP